MQYAQGVGKSYSDPVDNLAFAGVVLGEVF